jgi:exodeoxyribonuclease VII large subunit
MIDIDIYSDYDDGDFNFLTPHESDKPYTVSEINAGIAQILDSRNTLVWVEGELSGWKSYPSGHCYFKLKDADSQIPGVMWKSSAAKLDFRPQDSAAVIVIASIRVYEKGGYYQLDVHRMMPAGVGALHLAFEKLKEKLLKEGLFDEKRKRPLPSSVSTLGVITSKNGAALWDIVRVVAKRAPQTDIVLIDTPVQGDKAAARIAESIRAMNEFGDVDLMIVGRGGGSAEDLWAFNEESVARAIYESRIPVISAVGHEIDFTIADFVADVRAPTPSAAAEMAVPDTRERERYFELCAARFAGGFSRYFSGVRERVEKVKFSRALRRPITMAQDAAQSLDEAKYRFGKRISSLFSLRNKQVRDLASRLNALSPLTTLRRGYSVVLDKSGNSIRSSKGLKIGDPLKITFADGAVGAEGTDVP